MKDRLRLQRELGRGWGGEGADGDRNDGVPGSICAPHRGQWPPRALLAPRQPDHGLHRPLLLPDSSMVGAARAPAWTEEGRGLAFITHQGYGAACFGFPLWMKRAGQGWWLWDSRDRQLPELHCRLATFSLMLWGRAQGAGQGGGKTCSSLRF